MAKRDYAGVYANMEFPPYQYQPYPRHVTTGPHGQYEIANNEDEERRIKSKFNSTHTESAFSSADETVAPVVDHEREILISRALDLGVPINRKWSKDKLKRIVSEAEAAVDDLPADEVQSDEDKSQPDLFEESLESEDKDELIEQAKELGIPATRVWGVPRLKASIKEALENK
jgi:hypothetical protein